MLGNDSYGILTLGTAIIGYFSLMDINLTQGSMRYIAEYHAKGDSDKVNEVLSLSLLVYFVLGIVGAVILYVSVDLFLMDMLKIPQKLQVISRTVFHLSAIGFFISFVYNYLNSIPKSIHRFDMVAKIEVGFGIALMVLTVVLLYFGFNLLSVVILRLVMLLLNCITLFIAVKKTIPSSNFLSSISRDTVRKMLTFSGYSFFSKISATIVINSDRLVIGTIISSSAVTLYTVPFMLVSRLMNISVRLSMIMFPIASEMGSLGKREDLVKIYFTISKYIFFLNIALTTILCLFARQILQLWMGNDFAQQTYIILILLSLSFFTETLTNLPSLINDGLNFPQVTGFFAFGRATFGIVALIIGAIAYGLIGVAVAYFVSSVVMGIAFLLYVHKKTIKVSLNLLIKESFLASLVFSLIVGVSMLILKSLLPSSETVIIIELFFVAILFAIFGYTKIFSSELRAKITGYCLGIK
jgi:O-antigen/teichoic acid export membrane protein